MTKQFLIWTLALVLTATLACNYPDNRDKKISKLKLQCSELNSTGATLLYGEDGSGWFKLSKESCLDGSQYRITCFYEDCTKRWDAIFILKSDYTLDPNSPYEFIPISAYDQCIVKQANKTYTLTFVQDFTTCK